MQNKFREWTLVFTTNMKGDEQTPVVSDGPIISGYEAEVKVIEQSALEAANAEINSLKNNYQEYQGYIEELELKHKYENKKMAEQIGHLNNMIKILKTQLINIAEIKDDEIMGNWTNGFMMRSAVREFLSKSAIEFSK